MSPPKKRPAAKGTAKSKGAALAGLAFTKAIQVLQDEKTRAMIVEQYQTISDQARKWRSERRAEADAETDEPSRFSQQFGQRKLERRVENLTSSLETLTRGHPELATVLVPVSDAVAQLRVSVEIAGRLPFVKRKQAHLRIDNELDHLERSLFEASLSRNDS